MAINVQNVERFKFIAHKIIPLVYDDSLSYYEFLCKVMQKLNEVISSLDNQNEILEAFDKEILDFETRTDNKYDEFVNNIDTLFEAFKQSEVAARTAFMDTIIGSYNSSTHYAIGQYVRYGNNVYKCTTATSGESWNPAHWTQVVYADDLSERQSNYEESITAQQNTFETEITAQWNEFFNKYLKTLGVVQATGQSTENVMSQKATTDAINALNGDLIEQNHIHSLNLHKTDTDLKGYMINNDGSLLAYEEYTTTDFIKVESGNTYYRSKIYSVGLDSYYNSNKKFIRKLTSDEIGSKSITIPNGVKYIRISRFTTLTGIFDLYTEDVNETIPYQLTLDDDVKVKYENLVNVPSSIKDICSIEEKNILIMGDSIFGQVNDDTGVCAKIKEKTNANVFNCAFGGTQATGRSESNGYQAFDFYYLVDALISGDYTLQENAVATGTLPSYYGGKLNTLKALDWSTIDIITMNYGTNDFTYATGSERYRNRYKEALTKLISAYPHIKVVIITPAYRLWLSDGAFSEDSNTHKVEEYTLIDYITELTTVLCKDLNLPYIDLYNIGINQYNWNQYFASGDTTHQNEYGRNYIADIVAKKLCTM